VAVLNLNLEECIELLKDGAQQDSDSQWQAKGKPY